MNTLYIDGEWVAAASGEKRTITCPADGSEVIVVDEAGAEDAAKAIAAARRAFDSGEWPNTPAPERAALLAKLADLLERDKEKVARMESQDTGKRYAESLIDMDDIIGVFRHFSALTTQHAGRVVETGMPDVSSRVVTEPVGVCSLITPWNYPLLQTAWKVAPALAAGNTFVLKPAELTPQSAMWLMDALAEAGLPAGVANLVLGPGSSVGVEMTENVEVDLVSFTGGVVTGRAIMAAAAPTVKRVALELGGKNPNVVFADADLPAAIDNALTAIMLDSGQVCSAGARLIVEESIHDEVVDELVRRCELIRLGGPFDDDAETIMHWRERPVHDRRRCPGGADRHQQDPDGDIDDAGGPGPSVARAVAGCARGVGARGHGLEPAVGGEDGVIVAGQHDLDRRIRPGGDLQRIRMGLGPNRSVVSDGGRALRREAFDTGGQGAGRRFQNIQHSIQPGGVAAAGVDVRPVDGAPDDGLASRGDVVEDGLVRGQNPHRPDPRRLDLKGEGRGL